MGVTLSESQKRVNVIKIIANKILHFLYILGLILAAVLFVGMIILFILDPDWLAIDTCLDSGNVWDYEQRICREDCLFWQQEFGCIKLTEKQIQTFRKCRYNNHCPDWKIYKDICLNNQGAWNLQSQECKYDFVLADCFNLHGDWDYPEECNDKERK